jgi:hypothetical protein
MAYQCTWASRLVAFAGASAFFALGCSTSPSFSGGDDASAGGAGSDSGSGSPGTTHDGGAAGSDGGPENADASGGSAGEGGSGEGGSDDAAAPLPLPTQSEYLTTLYSLCDTLVATQITQVGATNYGGLVSQSTNPLVNPCTRGRPKRCIPSPSRTSTAGRPRTRRPP